MDPSYTSDKPGKSPMGMDLVPVYADEFPGGGEARNRNVVRVDPSFLQSFGVRTAVVERGSIPIEVRTVGILAHDEEQVHAVTTKYEGWIETARHNTIGEHIHQGTPLFEVYSPVLVTPRRSFWPPPSTSSGWRKAAPTPKPWSGRARCSNPPASGCATGT
jgi:membrane fusion protein, copper/silver efflux system